MYLYKIIPFLALLAPSHYYISSVFPDAVCPSVSMSSCSLFDLFMMRLLKRGSTSNFAYIPIHLFTVCTENLDVFIFAVFVRKYFDNSACIVQEVTAISLLQFIHPEYNAYLVNFISDGQGLAEQSNLDNQRSALSWQCDFTDPIRKAQHEAKMKSKDERPATQLSVLGIPPGNARHIVVKLRPT